MSEDNDNESQVRRHRLLVDHYRKLLLVGLLALVATSATTGSISVTVASAAIAISIFLLTQHYRNVVRQTLDQIANNDFDREWDLPEFQPQLDAIAKQYQDFMSEIASACTAIAAASEELSATAESTVEHSDHMNQHIDIVQSSIATLISGFKTVADLTQTVNTSISTSNTEVTNGMDLMGQSQSQMHDMISGSEQIKSLLSSINEISSQTNMLALNAAIEAARAGKLGAGFAVVAEEVNSLAERSQETAASISELVESNNNQILTGSDGLTLMEQGLRTISEMISDVVNDMEHIAMSTDVQYTVSEQTKAVVDEMTSEIQGNLTANKEVAQCAKQLANRAHQLELLLNR